MIAATVRNILPRGIDADEMPGITHSLPEYGNLPVSR
jgi:hypothetical protein